MKPPPSPHAGHRERLRERFLKGGAEAMPDYEMLELVLFSTLPRRDTKPLAKALIARFGSFAEVIAARRELLMEVEDVGESVVNQLKIVEAAAQRLAKGKVIGRGGHGGGGAALGGQMLTGGCFCGAVRYQAEGPVMFKGQCFCRTCQKLSGGAGNIFLVMGADGFRYTKGEPRSFQRVADAPKREFCADCGTQLTARSHRAPGVVLIKVGALDDPAQFEGPQALYWTAEKQAFHLLPPDVPAHASLPGRNN